MMIGVTSGTIVSARQPYFLTSCCILPIIDANSAHLATNIRVPPASLYSESLS